MTRSHKVQRNDKESPPKHCKVTFKIHAEPGCDVYVAGSFNAWLPCHQKLKDTSGKGCYRTTIKLPPGRYEYKFIVNGEWQEDPLCHDRVCNKLESMNSVIEVR